MLEFLDVANDWVGSHHRVRASGIGEGAAECGAANLLAEVLRRLDRGGREPVGRLIAAVAALAVVTLASATIGSITFAAGRAPRTPGWPGGMRAVAAHVSASGPPAEDVCRREVDGRLGMRARL